jgi:hypothetical protein
MNVGSDEDDTPTIATLSRRRGRPDDSADEDDAGGLAAVVSQASLRRRVDAHEVSVSQSYGPLLDDLCLRKHANLFISFAADQVPFDYEVVVGDRAIDLSMVVASLANGVYSELGALSNDVAKVFDNTVAYYGRRGFSDPMLLASKARSLKKWWFTQVALRTAAPSLNTSSGSHYHALQNSRQDGVKSGVSIAKKSTDAALKVVASLKAEFAMERDDLDEEVSEDVQQKRDEYERELMHAERVLRINIDTKAYLRCGPFELGYLSFCAWACGLI